MAGIIEVRQTLHGHGSFEDHFEKHWTAYCTRCKWKICGSQWGEIVSMGFGHCRLMKEHETMGKVAKVTEVSGYYGSPNAVIKIPGTNLPVC